MKTPRSLFLPLLVAALAVPLAAQTMPAAKPIAPASIAFVNSSAFLDETAGIKQLVRVNQGLELEFSTTQSDLSLLSEKFRTLVGELNKLNLDPVANASAITEKRAAAQKMQQDLSAKQQAAQEAYGKRAQEVQGPVSAEILKSLRAFAKERNIGMLFDSAKLGEAMIDAKPELDLTADFISYYNEKHP